MIDAKAYILRNSGSVPNLEDIQVSTDLTEGQVRLRMLYAGLCATQMEEIFLSSRNKGYIPHLFGHEGVGVIEQVGPGVEERRVGETCVIHWRKSSSGMDSKPGNYLFGNENINSGKVVAFSSQVVVPENRVTPVPQGFSFQKASLLGCSLTTGWGSVTKVGGIVSGQKVLVVGLGAVGTFAGLTARLSGCGELNGIDPVEPKRLRSCSVFDSTYASLSDLMGQEKAQRLSHDLIIDTSGDTSTINQLIEFAPGSARIILVGMPRDSTYPILPVQKMLDGLTISGSNGGEVDPNIDFSLVTSLFQSSLESERPILASVLPGDALDQAVSSFHIEPALRIILDLGNLGR